VGGAVFGRLLELDEAAADPGRAEIRRTNLEVDVGLAARLRDLAPAGADFVARSGIDPVIGSFVGGLFDRDDGERRGDVEGFKRPGQNAVIELGEGADTAGPTYPGDRRARSDGLAKVEWLQSSGQGRGSNRSIQTRDRRCPAIAY
jgi:hypothetical protein